MYSLIHYYRIFLGFGDNNFSRGIFCNYYVLVTSTMSTAFGGILKYFVQHISNDEFECKG